MPMLRSGELLSRGVSGMLNRPMLFVGVLIAAVVVPYVLLDKNLAQAARGQWERIAGKSRLDLTVLPEHSTNARPSASTIATAPAVSIEEAFRFDLHPQWVASRWPRVSTVLGEPKQLGMRVALVSGTRPDDVAGSLTYYFDEHHQLQRITFTGFTSDPRRLLTAVVTPNGLQSQPTTGVARYIAGDPEHPTSQVTVRHLPVLVAHPQRPQVEVAVDLRGGNVPSQQRKANSDPEVKVMPSGYRRW
jgi:hypothetical protein